MKIHFCGNCAWDKEWCCAKQNQEEKLMTGFGFLFPHLLKDADGLFIRVQREKVFSLINGN